MMRLLGSPQADADAPNEEHPPYLTFRLGDETFAMGVLTVKEIIELGPLTVVPLMPGCVRGVINLRGKVIPVIDLAVRFDGAPTQPTRRTCIVIVELGTAEGPRYLGVMVDAVHQVVDLPPGSIEPAPAFGARLRNDFIAGVGKTNDGLVIILDLDKVLSEHELVGLGAASASHDAARAFPAGAATGAS